MDKNLLHLEKPLAETFVDDLMGLDSRGMIISFPIRMCKPSTCEYFFDGSEGCYLHDSAAMSVSIGNWEHSTVSLYKLERNMVLGRVSSQNKSSKNV